MINPSRSQEEKWEKEKQKCLIRYYVNNPSIARDKLSKMNNKIKRNAAGKVAAKDIKEFNQMEEFRMKLNAERQRLKNG